MYFFSLLKSKRNLARLLTSKLGHKAQQCQQLPKTLVPRRSQLLLCHIWKLLLRSCLHSVEIAAAIIPADLLNTTLRKHMHCYIAIKKYSSNCNSIKCQQVPGRLVVTERGLFWDPGVIYFLLFVVDLHIGSVCVLLPETLSVLTAKCTLSAQRSLRVSWWPQLAPSSYRCSPQGKTMVTN